MPTPTIFEQDNQDATLGGRISLAREASGLTVAQVVKRLGVRVATYSAWETDRSEPPRQQARRTCWHFECFTAIFTQWPRCTIETSDADETKIVTIRASKYFWKNN